LTLHYGVAHIEQLHINFARTIKRINILYFGGIYKNILQAAYKERIKRNKVII